MLDAQAGCVIWDSFFLELIKNIQVAAINLEDRRDDKACDHSEDQAGVNEINLSYLLPDAGRALLWGERRQVLEGEAALFFFDGCAAGSFQFHPAVPVVRCMGTLSCVFNASTGVGSRLNMSIKTALYPWLEDYVVP